MLSICTPRTCSILARSFAARGAWLIAASTSAQPFDAVVSTELSTDGIHFTSVIAAAPGTPIYGRVGVRRMTGAALAGTAYSVRGDHTFSTPPAVTALSRIAPFTFGTQTLAVFHGPSSFRIDDSRDSEGSSTLGILSLQRPPVPGSTANTTNPSAVFRFQVVTPQDTGLIHLHVPIDDFRSGLVDVFESDSFPAARRSLTNIAVNGAWIFVGGNPCLGQALSTPPSQRVLLGQNVILHAQGESGILQWYKDAVELLDSPDIVGAESSTLTLRGAGISDAGDYVLFGMCSHTDVVRVDVFCPADFTNDGFVDGFDYDAFVSCYEGQPCPTSHPIRTADFNMDGFADAFDYNDFVEAFERGC